MWCGVTNDILECKSVILCLKVIYAIELQCISFHTFLYNGDITVYIITQTYPLI